jgi:hypothetical protein
MEVLGRTFAMYFIRDLIMRVTARQYRDEIYRLRAHPSYANHGFEDRRDSFLGLYLSLVPFVIAEYLGELTFSVIPSGVIFPLGYLLFWAFYYTYYRPGFLEENLSTPKHWELFSIPGLLIGVFIWFVKVTIVELSHIFLHYLLMPRRKAQKVHGAEHRQQQQPPHAQPSANSNQKPGLPPHIRAALSTLGLADCRDWKEIHHRYRELAKRFHPDLNQDITMAGKRFIIYDGAYRTLLAVKDKYFFEKPR